MMTWQWCGLVQLYEQIGTAVLQYGQNGYARTGDGQRTASDGSWTLKVVPPQKYDCWAASLRKDQKRPIVTNFRSFSRGFHIPVHNTYIMYVCMSLAGLSKVRK